MDDVVLTQKLNKNHEIETITLDQWVREHYSEEELRSIFLNMDRALKYIHDHGYCIEVFYPTEIKVLNNEDDHIQFNKLVELSSDPDIRREMVKEDIFNSSLIQVGIYSKSLKYLNPDFLRENFDEFSQFIPQDDIPYYRGVIQRGASVYFCEFALEKRNRDLEALEKELGEEGGKSLIKTPNDEDITNNKINDQIYRQINGMRDAAFINLLLIPTIILGVLLVFGIVSWLISYFSM